MKSTLAFSGIALVLALAGCGNSASAPSTTAPTSTGTTAAAPASTPSATSAAANASTDLTGTWKQSNSNSADSWQEAVVKDDVIEVFWVSNNGDTRSLFWSGSYAAPSGQAPFTWTSQGDVEKMKSAILASQDATKDFTYDKNSLSWKASLSGTTMTVRASKVG